MSVEVDDTVRVLNTGVGELSQGRVAEATKRGEAMLASINY